VVIVFVKCSRHVSIEEAGDRETSVSLSGTIPFSAAVDNVILAMVGAMTVVD
jgi:hypothetical protein